MSAFFINFMRSKGVEPTQNDVDHFKVMAKSYTEDCVMESCMNVGVCYSPDDVPKEFAQLKIDEKALDKACSIIEKVLDSGDYSRETEAILKSF